MHESVLIKFLVTTYRKVSMLINTMQRKLVYQTNRSNISLLDPV